MQENTYIVLVVEDERPLLEAIKIKLENNSIEAVTARSVTQALAYLEDLPKIDAIWLDHYLLGDQSGLELVATIKKADSPWKSIPIFVVSNTASNDKVSSYIQFGVEKYFIKSNYRLDMIISEIKEVLAQSTHI